MSWWWLYLLGWCVVSVLFTTGCASLWHDAGSDVGFIPDLKLWKRTAAPFMVILNEDLYDDPRIDRAFRKAISFWNTAVPDLWTPLGDIGKGTIIPVMPSHRLSNWSELTTPQAFAYTRLTLNEGHIWSAAIYIDISRLSSVSDLQLWRAIAHEMGHVSGLAHDTLRESVMYEKAIAEEPQVTRADLELLKGEYT